MPVSHQTRIAAQRTSGSLHSLADSLAGLAESAGDHGNEHPELLRIADLLEDAAENLSSGIAEGGVSKERLGRIADAFQQVGEALRSGF